MVAARGSGAGEEDREGDGAREDRAKPSLAAGREREEEIRGLGLEGLGGLWEAGPVEKEVARGLAGQLGWALSLTNLYQKRNRERKRKRGLGKDYAQVDNFPGLTKNESDPRKIERGMIERFKFKLI